MGFKKSTNYNNSRPDGFTDGFFKNFKERGIATNHPVIHKIEEMLPDSFSNGFQNQMKIQRILYHLPYGNKFKNSQKIFANKFKNIKKIIIHHGQVDFIPKMVQHAHITNHVVTQIYSGKKSYDHFKKHKRRH